MNEPPVIAQWTDVGYRGVRNDKQTTHRLGSGGAGCGENQQDSQVTHATKTTTRLS